MQIVRCPVCGGNGLVDEGFYRQTSGDWASAGGVETCRSCDGKGWVSVCEDDKEGGVTIFAGEPDVPIPLKPKPSLIAYQTGK